jgi:hypothetical protein
LSETTIKTGGQPKFLGGQPNIYIRNTMNKFQKSVCGQPQIFGLFRSLHIYIYIIYNNIYVYTHVLYNNIMSFSCLMKLSKSKTFVGTSPDGGLVEGCHPARVLFLDEIRGCVHDVPHHTRPGHHQTLHLLQHAGGKYIVHWPPFATC